MAEKPASPFVGLDKALLRPTKAQSAPPDEREATATVTTACSRETNEAIKSHCDQDTTKP